MRKNLKFEFAEIYPITDVYLSGLAHYEQVTRFTDGGARFIQLREKRAAPRQFYSDAVQALKIARDHSARLVINDRVDIALALGADGVHLGQDDLPPAAARKILGDRSIIGLSTHNLDQVAAAVKLPIDYIAVGPIFTTRTKENPDPVVGLDVIRAARDLIGEFPLVAIGGINFENLGDVLAAGADTAAMIGGLLAEPDQISSKLRTTSID